MAEQESIVPFPASDRRYRAEVSGDRVIAKAADLGKLLARIKSGAPLRPLKIVRGWNLSYAVMAAWMLLNIVDQFHTLSCQRTARAWDGQMVLLGINVAALFAICMATRSSLMVSVDGIEMRSWFVRQPYRFSDMIGGFELLQRRYLPGFDVVFRLAPSAPATIGAPTKLVRVIKFDAITDSEFLEFLKIYKGKS